KIGTTELLYYTSYKKMSAAFNEGKLVRGENQSPPSVYLKEDSGFLFRFPFPDEDKLPFGSIKEPFNRVVPVKASASDAGEVGIAYQKLVHRESDGKLILATVCQDTADNELYRIEDPYAVKNIVRDIVKNHILSETDPDI